jgi:linoleate 9S-lipoxygenase
MRSCLYFFNGIILLICVIFLNFYFVVSGKGLIGKETFLSKHLPQLPTLGARQDAFSIFFEYDANFGIPGAFYIRNYTQAEFFLVSVTLDDIPNRGSVQFVCNSWIYNFKSYKNDRIFFTNDVSFEI